jgi:hypothetical protein
MVRRRFVIAGLMAVSLPAPNFGTEADEPMQHAVLLGDSIFDNAAYVAPGEEVIRKLKQQLPAGFQASLLARDGAVIADVATQLTGLPADATHLVVSVGGNDALLNAGILEESATSMADALTQLRSVRDGFRADYDAMLGAVLRQKLPTAICTIYDAQLPDLEQRELAAVALTVLNDVITRSAVTRRLPLIDLRVIFSHSSDYANAIEPSGQGGRKLAAAILELLQRHDFHGPAAFYA